MITKLVVASVVGAALVGGIVLAKGTVSSPEAKVCTRMAELCGTDGDLKDLDACVDDMKKAHKLAGDVPFERSASCIEESKSCAAAAGCMMGGVGVGAAGEMMKGFGTALTK